MESNTKGTKIKLFINIR